MRHFRPLQRLLNFLPKQKSLTPARCLLILMTCLLTQQGMARIWYVKAGATGDGSSWSNPSGNLQNIMNTLSASGDEIWIASVSFDTNSTFTTNGTYGSGATLNTNSFILKSGVKVYGGFYGFESNIGNRPTNITTNQITLKSNITDNYGYPIVYCSGANTNTLLDRITISDGYNQNISGVSNSGFGGGLFMTGAALRLKDVSFTNNYSGNRGGAIHMENGSTPVFTNVKFLGNTTQNQGGAVNIENSTPSFTGGSFTGNVSSNAQGGALYFSNCANYGQVSGVLFNSNQANNGGGALQGLDANYIAQNCVFVNNSISGPGAAVANYYGTINGRSPGIYNCVFYNNTNQGKASPTSNDNGAGAIYNLANSATITNCTFYKNTSRRLANYAGAVMSEGNGTGTQPTVNITNCLFVENAKLNASGGLDTYFDVGTIGTLSYNINYSSYRETGIFGGVGNTGAVSAPFINAASPLGPDNVWMTADDGLRLTLCNAATLIDKGNNDFMGLTTDVAGQPRKVDIPTVADGGNGTSPIVDMGAYENQEKAVVGAIGNAHAIPYPQELSPDYVTNIQSPTGTISGWQQKEDNTTWMVAIPASTSLQYPIPQLAKTTYYRRAVSYCGTTFYTDSVQIKVINPPNGAISGRVLSKNGTGVQGILIKVSRLVALPGSPAGYTYTDTTDAAGVYSISPIFYGDNTAGNVTATFRVTPSKPNHSFSIPYLDKELSTTIPQITGVDFTDTTVISITGTITQQCTTCNAVGGTEETQTCAVDSVAIYKDGLYSTVTGLRDGVYGRYGITVSDPVQIRVEPRYLNHRFNPASTTLTPTNNVSGIDFRDTTTRAISGRLTAGCSEYIGTAILEFTDVLTAPDGSVRNNCFRKRVTTNAGSGSFSIRLPARKYRVRVIIFNKSTTLTYPIADADAVATFINALPADSLTRDISTRDTTLNLVYNRPPEISIASGLNFVCTIPSPGFSLIRQAATDSFVVRVTQGSAALNCPLADTSKIRVITNVQQESATETLQYTNAATGVKVKLKGGTPNITGDKLKDLFIDFTDKYNRATTQFRRKVLVTGVKADAATFTTVSPEIPLVVLHDPPGDASSSTWQQSTSISNAFRFYTAKGKGTEGWAEAKIGAAVSLGLGVATEASAWGIIRGSVGVSSTNTSADETILTTTTSQNFSTSGNPEVTGNSGDVFIGAALNLIYSVATEIGFTSCGNITSTRKLIIANNGFATQYIYSEDYITNTLIPNLQSLAQLQPTNASRYLNQVSVWQQVVDNNAENKRRAAFVQNYSFDGSAGPYTNTTTTSASKSSSIEFAMEVNGTIAAELGFEIAGAGASGGVNVNFRTESGGSISGTTTNETTIGYTLDDNTPGDYFSVNVKKDPVYNTPVFELAAGTASCPPEPGAQPRDAVFFTANNPVATGVSSSAPATFNLKIVNTSASTSTNPNDKRTYKLNYVQSSNVANETITIAGTPYNSNSPYVTRALGYLDSIIVPVSITRQSGSSVYSYEGEQFAISSSCGDDLNATVAVSAYFTSPCSSISMDQPTDGWQINNSSNNQIFIKPSGYTLANLTSVNLQYSTGNSWNDVFPSLTTAQLADGFTFTTTNLPEGSVSFRLRLDCSSGTVYSGRATGIIDRRAPRLFGRPDPTDDNYVNGDAIAFTYDEKLNTDPAALQVTMRRLSNNTLLPVTASIYENKIAIVPGSGIAGFTGDSIRLIVSGIKDVYGNVKTTPDTIRFTVGTSVVATGNSALTVSVVNPSVYKNDTATIRVYFTLPAAAVNDTRVNYTIGGTALSGVNYTASYTGADALYASFNGSTGSIKIPAGQRQAMLTLKPIIGDTSFSPDKTIIISATEGGDYGLSAATSVTGYLTSNDGITEYVFTGDGNWNIRSNWQNGKMPLTTLVSGKTITINPSGTCILNVAQTIRPGSTIRVKENRRFIIQGNLRQN